MSKIKSLIPANNYKSPLIKEPVDDPQGIFKKVIFSSSPEYPTIQAVKLCDDDELIEVSKAKSLLRRRLSPGPSETEFLYWFRNRIIKAFLPGAYDASGKSTGTYRWIATATRNDFQDCFCSRKEIEQSQPSQRLVSFDDLMKLLGEQDSVMSQRERKAIIKSCVEAGIIKCITPAGGDASFRKQIGENHCFLNDAGIEAMVKKHILPSPKSEAEKHANHNDQIRIRAILRWQPIHDEVKRCMAKGKGKYAALTDLFNEKHPSVRKCKTSSSFITSYLHAEEKYFIHRK